MSTGNLSARINSTSTLPTEASSPVDTRFDREKIDSVFSELDQIHLPGAAVGIAISGRPVYRRGFGLANMELPIPLSSTTRMRVYSISKQFTALAYMLLCENGQASIDDPIGKYLPELHPVTRNVTARQLMGHTGGLRDVLDLSWQFSGTGWSVSSAELLSFYKDIDDVNAVPGTQWIYNNGGYLMLSLAIERITDRSLEEVLLDRIFVPIGMYDSILRRFDTDFVPNSATQHMPRPAGGYEKSYMGGALAGEGGIVSTVDDMLRWLAHMDTPVIGSAATRKLMQTPQVLANGTSTGYGLGLEVHSYRGTKTVFHGGGGMGGNAQMLKVPSAALDVVIMVNRGDVWAPLLADRILDLCLAGLEPVRGAPPRHFATGVFRSVKTGRVLELRSEAGAQIASIDGHDMPMEVDERGVLRPTGIFQSTKQSVGLVGDPERPTMVRLSDFGNIDELVRESPPTETAVETIAGDYQSASTGIAATILATEGGPMLATSGRLGSVKFRLECLADGVWRARSATVEYLGGILVFDHRRKSFSYSCERTRGLVFHRV